MDFEKTNLVKMGKHISELRKKKKLTQVQLADLLNVSNKTISKWELGDLAPDITLLRPISEILGVEVEEILTGKSKKVKGPFDKILTSIFILVIIIFLLIFFVSSSKKESGWIVKEIESEERNYVHGYIVSNGKHIKVIIDDFSSVIDNVENGINYFKCSLVIDNKILFLKEYYLDDNSTLNSISQYALLFEEDDGGINLDNNMILNIEYNENEIDKGNINIYLKEKK